MHKMITIDTKATRPVVIEAVNKNVGWYFPSHIYKDIRPLVCRNREVMCFPLFPNQGVDVLPTFLGFEKVSLSHKHNQKLFLKLLFSFSSTCQLNPNTIEKEEEKKLIMIVRIHIHHPIHHIHYHQKEEK